MKAKIPCASVPPDKMCLERHHFIVVLAKYINHKETSYKPKLTGLCSSKNGRVKIASWSASD